MMKKIAILVTLLFMSFSTFLPSVEAEAKESASRQTHCISQNAVQLKGDIRKLGLTM